MKNSNDETVISIHDENMAETSLQFVSVNAPLLFIEEQENQTLQGTFHVQTKGETYETRSEIEEIPPAELND